jgi:hypothetical protein
MAYTLDPRWFLPSDDGVKPFILDTGRVDLAAADAPTVATGRFIVSQLDVPPSQFYIIKGMSFYAGARINTGLGTETFQLLDPVDADGFFSFDPQVNNQPPWIINLDYNAPRIAAGPLSNASGRQHSAGIGHISDRPWTDVQQSWVNPMFTIPVPSSTQFRVIFSILPPSAVAPLPAGGQFGIGGAGGTRRVDFAGAVIAGMQLTEQAFARMMKEIGAAPGI